jgi:hypothetical protein
MSNEPVAWIGKDELQFGFADTRVTNEKESWDDIPLYTHPAKTLTISDRDILKIVHDKFTKFGFEADYIVEDIELIDFARAILRKAQEK